MHKQTARQWLLGTDHHRCRESCKLQRRVGGHAVHEAADAGASPWEKEPNFYFWDVEHCANMW